MKGGRAAKALLGDVSGVEGGATIRLIVQTGVEWWRAQFNSVQMGIVKQVLSGCLYRNGWRMGQLADGTVTGSWIVICYACVMYVCCQSTTFWK